MAPLNTTCADLPSESSSKIINNSKTEDAAKKTTKTKTYIRCDSKYDYGTSPDQTTSTTTTKTPSQVNASLNLNLGLPINPENPRLRRVIKFLNDWFIAWWEVHLFRVWNAIPLKFRRQLIFLLWRGYLPLHRWLLGRRTGIHPEASEEYHALTTVMWWGRLFPVTIRRMRFMLSQLSVYHKEEEPPSHNIITSTTTATTTSTSSSSDNNNKTKTLLQVETIECDLSDTVETNKVPSPQRDHLTVRGKYIRVTSNDKDNTKNDPMAATTKTTAERGDNDDDDDDYFDAAAYTNDANNDDASNDKVVLWLYGGAFLAGCVQGNMGPARTMALRVRRNVFLPHYRLLPEASFDDMLWDVALAYRYLIVEKKIRPENILVLGISSGGGLAVRLMQFVGELQTSNDDDDDEPSLVESILRPDWMPGGAVLIGPFVDYTEPKGTLSDYPKHDLIVNQSVTETGFPYMERVLGSHANRTRASPVHRSFSGLPRMCVVVSEHEVVYDQTILLVNRARREGVAVSLGVWQYMCHVFCFLSSFIPEGKEAMEFVYQWILEQSK